MNEKLISALFEYVKGNITSDKLMGIASETLDIYKVDKDGQFYYILSKLFDDPDDNIIQVKKEYVINILSKYLKQQISLEEFQLWFWDIVGLNVDTEDPDEEELIVYLVHTFDNQEIFEIDNDMIKKTLEVLNANWDSVKTIKLVKEIISN
ncbi:hypothetical protein ACWF7H_28080 [Peribacillus butanolivorans]|uniref:hypothetical protein n=1 Tax=Peribacillus butanolivorans TaxID=421767 RepID=UPI0035DCF6C7